MALPDLPAASELEEVRQRIAPHASGLRGAHILITGGTGIIGKWLIASLLHADTQDQLGLRISVLSRSPGTFMAQIPTIGLDARVQGLQGDVRAFTLPPSAAFSHLIHAATDVVAAISPSDLIDTCVNGTRNALQIAKAAGVGRMLLLSSGAVYGKTDAGQGAIPEDYVGPLDPLSPDCAYAQGKRTAELLCAIEAEAGAMEITIARCFAMVGPYLPLDRHFAIGNFIQAALMQQPVSIKGDGTPVRSYLYLSDVAARLLLLLLAGRSSVAYNVGGSEPVSIAQLAHRVLAVLGVDVPVLLGKQSVHGAHAQRYYPDSTRINHAWGLAPEIGLDQAILRTANWYRPAYLGRN